MQALFYPTIISIVALVITLIMLTFVVPRFAELFQHLHGSLPAITVAVIYVSEWMRHQLWVILLFSIFVILSLRICFKKTVRFKKMIDNLVIKIPFIKIFFQKILIANFARHLSITLSAGIPILDAIKIITPATTNVFYQQALLLLHNEMSKGQQLHRAMLKNVLFPHLLIQMVKIGEETGVLAPMLEKVGELYEADCDHLINNLSHLLEPLIMVCLGVLIGGLVIAMYLPIFKLGTVL